MPISFTTINLKFLDYYEVILRMTNTTVFTRIYYTHVNLAMLLKVIGSPCFLKKQQQQDNEVTNIGDHMVHLTILETLSLKLCSYQYALTIWGSSMTYWLGVITLVIHLPVLVVVLSARIHLSLVEFPLAHWDTLEHLFSTTHQPHRGFLSDTQLEHSLCMEHSSSGTLITYKTNA